MKKAAKFCYALFIYLFLYGPLVVLGVFSFNSSKFSTSWKGFTLSWYESLLANDQLLDAALHSVVIASISATIACLIGTLTAVALHRYRFLGRKILSGVLYILIMSPDIVMGISLLVLFMALKMPLGFWTLLLSHITFCIPFVTVTVLTRLSGFDKNIIEAAMDLGAGEYQIFRHILLPLLMPAVLAGWLLSFTLSMDDVIISFFTTGPTYEVLPLRIYSMVRLGVKPEVNALSMVMFVVTLIMVVTTQLLLKERK